MEEPPHWLSSETCLDIFEDVCERTMRLSVGRMSLLESSKDQTGLERFCGYWQRSVILIWMVDTMSLGLKIDLNFSNRLL